MARTAVVAGTATAVSNRVSRRQANRWADQNAAAYEQEAAYYEPAPAPAAPSEPDTLGQLKELGELKAAGVLTEAEFEQQKAKILGQ
jgi:hypothetical protein